MQCCLKICPTEEILKRADYKAPQSLHWECVCDAAYVCDSLGFGTLC